MIITADEYNLLVPNDTRSNFEIELKLKAIEESIRKYTNNNFQNKNIRAKVYIRSSTIDLYTPLIKKGDTIEISQSLFNNGLYVVIDNSNGISLDRELTPEDTGLLTKIEYPDDIKVGVSKLLKWEFEKGDKVGIQSETISRHSVTYFNMDSDNSILGYPKSLLGFLKPYRKARF